MIPVPLIDLKSLARVRSGWCRDFKSAVLAGVFGLLAGLGCLGATSLAYAVETPALPKYEVTGFRDVRFGMTEAEVRAAATKAFAVKPADFNSAVNPVEGTTVLTVKVASLDPVPGPARIAYIFGYSSKKLIQVNVIWGEETSTPLDAGAMITAGTRLERYFAGFTWKKDTTRGGVPVGDNTVVLFSGEDEKKGAVRLIADGVKFQVQREGNQQTTSPEPKGPPKLIINYIADRDTPERHQPRRR